MADGLLADTVLPLKSENKYEKKACIVLKVFGRRGYRHWGRGAFFSLFNITLFNANNVFSTIFKKPPSTILTHWVCPQVCSHCTDCSEGITQVTIIGPPASREHCVCCHFSYRSSKECQQRTGGPSDRWPAMYMPQCSPHQQERVLPFILVLCSAAMPHPAKPAHVVVSPSWFLGWMNIQMKGLRVPGV